MALVGADAYKFKDTERNKADLIRAGFYWKKEFVESSNPEGDAIKTKTRNVKIL
ncbi:MAG: hypothetical protein ACI8ZX_002354 [Planctomycetota bacterium]|jgi:hypothetical protein